MKKLVLLSAVIVGAIVFYWLLDQEPKVQRRIPLKLRKKKKSVLAGREPLGDLRYPWWLRDTPERTHFARKGWIK